MTDACDQNHTEIKQFVERRVNACKGDIAEELNKMNATLTEFSEAFPRDKNGRPDFGGHRDYHDAKIAAARAEAQFWTELRLDIAKKGAVGLIVIVIGLLFVGLQVKFGIVPK